MQGITRPTSQATRLFLNSQGHTIQQFRTKKMQVTCGDLPGQVGLVLGCYNADADYTGTQIWLTEASKRMNAATKGKFLETLKMTGPTPKKGECRILYGIHQDFPAIAVVGVGEDCYSYNEVEELDENKESIRCAAAIGSKALTKLHVRTIYVESFGHAESCAEGANMAIWIYQELKNIDHQVPIPRLELYDDCDYTSWQIGMQKAAAQNLARQLSETPANIMTPTSMSQSAVEVLTRAGVSVEVKVRQWAKLMEMEAFLAAARGSCEPPIFLEASYYGCNPDISPVVIVGKGVTYDSGGLCLKSDKDLAIMRGDMTGAAVGIAAVRAAAALQLPINIRLLTPLSENMPGACAMKPGDIIRAKNGKTIVVEDTDFDGRIAMADALAYAANFNPKFVLSFGTLTKEVKRAMGTAASAVFSNNESLFEQMRISGIHTGDRVWRFPLYKMYSRLLTQYPGADVGEPYRPSGAPCTAAAFLSEFIPPVDWIHLDIYSVFWASDDRFPYLRRGFTGRPTRTIVEFLAQLACKNEASCPT